VWFREKKDFSKAANSGDLGPLSATDAKLTFGVRNFDLAQRPTPGLE